MDKLLARIPKLESVGGRVGWFNKSFMLSISSLLALSRLEIIWVCSVHERSLNVAILSFVISSPSIPPPFHLMVEVLPCCGPPEFPLYVGWGQEPDFSLGFALYMLVPPCVTFGAVVWWVRPICLSMVTVTGLLRIPYIWQEIFPGKSSASPVFQFHKVPAFLELTVSAADPPFAYLWNWGLASSQLAVALGLGRQLTKFSFW